MLHKFTQIRYNNKTGIIEPKMTPKVSVSGFAEKILNGRLNPIER